MLHDKDSVVRTKDNITGILVDTNSRDMTVGLNYRINVLIMLVSTQPNTLQYQYQTNLEFFKSIHLKMNF